MFILFFICLTFSFEFNGMLQLDTINNDGTDLQYPEKLKNQLIIAKEMGLHGVMGDVWWGLVEKKGSKQYEWGGYLKLVEMIRNIGLKFQPVMSFHKCGGNVGDSVTIPLPQFVLNGGKKQDAFFKDYDGNVDDEYISFAADDIIIDDANKRTPIKMYYDFMKSFRETFKDYLEDGTIDEIQVGSGPCGETRYPSYPASLGWVYPGIGEFMVNDKNFQAKLKKDAKEAGHEDWGKIPSGLGKFNSKPTDTDIQFFKKDTENNYESEYGKWFLKWYSGVMIDHTERVLGEARKAFGGKIPLANKVAGIHWWHGYTVHAAEITAGYYVSNDFNTYERLDVLLSEYGARYCFTCLEKQKDSAQNCGGTDCYSEPQKLVAEVYGKVTRSDRRGENALEMFGKQPTHLWYDDNTIKTLKENIPKYDLDGFTYLRLQDFYFDYKFVRDEFTSMVSDINESMEEK